MNPSSITLNKAGISAMPLQLQRWPPSLIVPKEWIGCPKSWWEREAQPNEPIIDHTKQSWYFSNATSALTLAAELNRSSEYIQQAYIHVYDNVYTSFAVPMFQSQSTFVKIKIQLDNANIQGGVLLSNTNTIVINSVNILQQQNYQIVVLADSQFNILQSISSSTSIYNLMININIVSSFGNITLIGHVEEYIDIVGYQVLGTYESSNSISMITLNMTFAVLKLNQMNFMPQKYNSGNGSSYILSYISSCTISIYGLSIILGNESFSQVANKISTDNTNSYQFGGVINYVNNSIINITQIIQDGYYIHQSEFINGFGFIIGQTIQSDNKLNVQDVCFSQIFNTTHIQLIGLIGQFEGKYSIKHVNIKIDVRGIHITSFGSAVAVQTTQCISSEINDFKTSLHLEIDKSNTNRSVNGVMSAVFGYQYAQNCSIVNVIAFNCNITALHHAGGFSGYSYLTNFTIQNSTIKSSIIISTLFYTGAIIGRQYLIYFTMINSTIYNCNIISDEYSAGGIIGTSFGSLIKLQNSCVKFMNIQSPNYVGIIVGCDHGAEISGSNTYSIQNSYSFGENYFNSVIQSNCPNFTNDWSQQQC
ncbi:Hypothetical_protein [Hexamita inflata]|uniref:Hypothetical_protein n=1 Tax=Hexamita inflata TaxID=28002 RepID=A0AA86PFC4_9EUKA|nr:Hypothetical protein HINF_LOCUS25774 [Hexamita inflata]